MNPAPMRPMPLDLIGKVDVLVPNQHEAAGLLELPDAGSLDPESAARRLLEAGAGTVVITLGAQGAYVASKTAAGFVEPVRVEAVDTTAAGDAFTASLAVAMAEGADLLAAAQFATRVAAIVVTRMGAQPSMPSRDEIDLLRSGN